MEVALPTGGSKKHVEEWSRIDRLTGMLEHARVEADHWATNTSNSSHHFGKIVDSRARNLADGSVEQKQQTKQLEVFQAQIPGGSVQVIRSHTKTSSSWHSKQIDGVSKSENRSKISANDNFHDNFNDFKERTCSNMNFNLEKSKAQAAKALGVRRPPSRFRPANAEKPTAMNGELTKSLFDETREVCERVHREMGESLFANDFGLMNGHAGDRVRKESDRGAVGSSKLPPLLLDRSPLKAISKKCTSDENLSSDFVIDEAGSANDGQNDMSASADSAAFSSAIADWKRTSKMRWSLQYPSKSRRYESENENENESENGSVSKTELQRVMEKVLNRRIAVDPPATKVGKPVDSDVRPDDSCSTVFKKPQPARAAKRNSFVTEQTLKETRSKLKHWEKDEDVDDGIDTEVSNRSETVDDSSGKERLMNGTGSLESRSSKIGTNAKSDDWFNRRKSYGFEAVYPQNYISKTAQNVIDSSTDSGICRSSELVSGAKSTKPESSVRLHGGTTVITFSEEQSDSGGNATDSIGTGSNEATSRSSYEPVKITVPSAADINNGYRNAEESSESEGTWSGGPANFRPMKLATDFQPLKSPLTVKNQIENSDHQQSSGGNGPHHERKPKKVGFCKTEVHFAAEPGKINIVETDEKPPPTNLYRRRNRRNSSPDSPITAKRNSGSLPETKFGDYEKTLLTDNIAHHAPDDIIGNSENGNGPGHTDDSMSGQSSTTDNGLAVRISSGTSTSSTAGATTTDIRRASWSVPENRGYSTKINVGHKGATTVVGNMGKPAAAGMQRMRHSICGETASGSLWEVTNTSVPEEFGGSNHTYLPKVSTKKPVDLLQKPVVRQCKTTAVSINIGRGPFRDVGKHFQPITKPTSTSATISSENNTNFQPVVHKTKVKSQAVDQTANKPYHQTTKKNPSTTILNSSNDKTSAAPTRLKESAAKVIYHNITIMTDAEKGTSDAKHQKIAARSSQQRASSFAAVRKDVESSGSRNDSLSSRKKISAHERSKLFESGRDSWLNIPKEQKLGSSALTRKSKWATGNANTTGSSKSSVCASKDVATVDDRDPTLEELTKAADEIKLVVGGYTDLESSYITSSEDDATTLTKRKHDKRVNNAVPLTTIKEKSIGSTTRTKQANRFPEKISSGYDVAVSTARKPDAKSEDRSKKRQARMLHRACSREMLLQNNKTASSDSENSELESEKQNTSKAKPKFIRKLKVQSKPSKSTITTAIAETSTNRHHSTRSSSSARGSLPTAVSSTGNSTNRIANNNSSSSVCSAGVTEKSTMKKFERSDQPINNSRSQKNTSEMRLRISGAHNKLNDSSARQKKKQSSLICPDIKTYVR